MKRRETSKEERELFERSYKETRPLQRTATSKTPLAKDGARKAGDLDGHTAERLRRGAVEPEARIDLHGMSESVAHASLLKFLRHHHARGARLVLVVTGKGAKARENERSFFDSARGTLKKAVPRWLEEPGFVGFVSGTARSHIRHGGEGALYVYLRKLGR